MKAVDADDFRPSRIAWMDRSITMFAFSARDFSRPLSHGYPFGCSADRTVGGPVRSFLAAVEKVSHGGAMIMTSYCPFFTFSIIARHSLSTIGVSFEPLTMALTSSKIRLMLSFLARFEAASLIAALWEMPEKHYRIRSLLNSLCISSVLMLCTGDGSIKVSTVCGNGAGDTIAGTARTELNCMIEAGTIVPRFCFDSLRLFAQAELAGVIFGAAVPSDSHAFTASGHCVLGWLPLQVWQL